MSKVKLNEELVNRAKDIGIDVDELIERVEQKYSKYSDKTILTKIKSELRKKIEYASADKTKGIIAGMRDRFGKSWPIKLAFVRSDGNHMEISTWGTSISGNDTDIQISAPVMAEISMKHDPEYDTYQLVEILKYKSLADEEVVEKLLKIAKPISRIQESDKYHVIVTKGKISSVRPATAFVDGKPEGTHPVLETDARSTPKQWPVMQIQLTPVDGTRCRLVLERPRYAIPTYHVYDLFLLCHDAIGEETHHAQAEFVEEGIYGRSVIIVGVVTNYNRTRDRNDTPVDYVDIGVAGLYEYEGDEDEERKDIGQTEAQDSMFTEGGATTLTIGQIKKKIRKYYRALSIDLSELDADTIVEALDLGVPVSVVERAMKEVQNEDR